VFLNVDSEIVEIILREGVDSEIVEIVLREELAFDRTAMLKA
jgi:hypothetical protein